MTQALLCNLESSLGNKTETTLQTCSGGSLGMMRRIGRERGGQAAADGALQQHMHHQCTPHNSLSLRRHCKLAETAHMGEWAFSPMHRCEVYTPYMLAEPELPTCHDHEHAVMKAAFMSVHMLGQCWDMKTRMPHVDESISPSMPAARSTMVHSSRQDMLLPQLCLG